MPRGSQKGNSSHEEDPALRHLRSVYFGQGQYPRLAKVLEATARRHCPSWSISVERIEDSRLKRRDGNAGYSDNTWKLRAWADIIESAPEGDEILLVDSDVFILAPLDGIWDQEFDLLYTERSKGAPFPINGGVVAVRVTEASRRFMRLWVRRDQELFDDFDLHREWRKRYGGMNQSSFGSLLETGHALRSWLRLATAPCREWNACDPVDWRDFGPHTRIVHVKSELRMTIFQIVVDRAFLPLAGLWTSEERRATIGS